MIGAIYLLLLVPAQGVQPVASGGGVSPGRRRTVQASSGWPVDNSAALAKARRRRRQQHFLTIQTLTQ